MATVFLEKDSLFFVGGQGNKSGHLTPGGCTLDWWDNAIGSGSKSEKKAAMDKLMGVNGDAKYVFVNAAFVNSIKQFTVADTTGIEAGMVMYVTGSNITTGRYEITDVADGTHITVAGIIGTVDNNDSTVVIGGSFQNISAAVSTGALDATSYNVDVYTSLNETVTTSISFSCEGYGYGNTYLSIIGFNEVPADMDVGGQYYQSPLEAYKNGTDANAFVKIEQTTPGSTIVISGRENVRLKNLHIKGVTRGLYGYDNCRGSVLEHCTFSGAFTAYAIEFYKGYFGTMFDCFIDGSLFAGTMELMRMARCSSMTLFGNIIVGKDNVGVLVCDGTFFFNNLVIGGSYGLYCGVSDSNQVTTVANNIFHDQHPVNSGCSVVHLCYNWGKMHLLNNIFAPRESDANILKVIANGGSIVEVANNCIYHPDGLSDPWPNTKNPKETIEEDPGFVDVSSKDFRVVNPNVLRGGRKDIAGNSMQIGAVLQDYQFANAGRMANM
ncbi:hypothetical protein KAR91_12680, partial [Candidatus Pacearchaeota archaeon]|nr:hypothetical protein [Candidatus Pacearchaeota archaeon]